MKKNLLFLISSKKNTGVSAYALNILKHLKNLDNFNFSLATNMSVNIENIETFKYGYGSKGINFPGKYKDVALLKKILKEKKIEIIHTFKLYDFLIVKFLKIFEKYKFKHIHSISEKGKEKYFFLYKLLKSDKFLVPSYEYINSGIPHSFFLYPFIDPSFWIKKNNQIKDTINILIVSKITKDRNWQILINVLRKKIFNFRFFIFGKGNYLKELKKELLATRNDVIFLGYKDLLNAYKMANVGLILSTGTDLFCRTLFEFLAQNIPVIGYETGIIKDVLHKFKVGKTFKNEDELARVLESVNRSWIESLTPFFSSFHEVYNSVRLIKEYEKFYTE